MKIHPNKAYMNAVSCVLLLGLLPRVIPIELVFHLTLEHQAVSGEDLWPPGLDGHNRLGTLCRCTIITAITFTCMYKKISNAQEIKKENHVRLTLSSAAWLDDLKTSITPLLVWQWYEPEFLIRAEAMVWLLPDSWSSVGPLYHRISHPEETLMWQVNETESPVYISSWSGFFTSVTLGVVSEGWK